MKLIKRHLFSFLIMLFSTSILFGQESVVASGSDISGSGGTVSYSFGQLVYTTNESVNWSSAQGVQQPIEISTELGIPEALGINLISIFPNPTNSFVILKIENYSITNLSSVLFDSNGRLIFNKKIVNDETQISLEECSAGVYFFKILDGNKEVKVFKILKK